MRSIIILCVMGAFLGACASSSNLPCPTGTYKFGNECIKTDGDGNYIKTK